MKLKEFTDMLGSFSSIIVYVEKDEIVIAYAAIAKKDDGFYDIDVNLELANEDVEFSIAEINDMEVKNVTTAANAHLVRLWVEV